MKNSNQVCFVIMQFILIYASISLGESLMIHAGSLIPNLKTRTTTGAAAQPASQSAQKGKGKKKKK